jgi:hypothetical protein
MSIVPVLAAGIPAVGAVAAAGYAAREARRSKTAELQASRILDLERRLSESRQKVFEPLVEALGRFVDFMGKGEALDDLDVLKELLLDDLFKFAHWVQIYGSDEAVHATMHFMQAVWAQAPANVLIRLQGELVLAARRELGHRDTEIKPVENFAMRINDAYTDPAWRADLSDPIDVVFARHGWTPPWAPVADSTSAE